MKDKEKQILAITQDLSDCLQYDIEDSDMVDTYDTACNLVNKGWVKLPKDNVVLSRDNYNRLKRDSDLFEELLKKKVHLETVIELSNAQYEKVLEENKSLLRLISLIDDLPEESLLDLDKWIEAIKAKERKETAEKIILPEIEFCKALYGNCNSQTDEYKKGFTDCCRIVQMLLNDLSKQFGVEIKE